MFGLNPLSTYAILALIVTNALTGIMWGFADSKADKYQDKLKTCAAEHKASIAQIDAMGRLAKEHAAQTEKEHAENSTKTSNAWAAALGVVRADAATKRLRDAASRSAGGGSLPEAGPNRPGNAEANADAIPAPERVAQDCAETTVTANFLQTYIERLESINE